MELAVAALERLGDALDGVDNIQTGDEVHVYTGRVADQTKNGLEFTLRDMDAQTLSFQPFDQLVALFFLYTVFQYDDHCVGLRLFL